MSNISIISKKEWGFEGYSKISHSYDLKSIKGNKVVIDHATGLIWHQSGSDKVMEWYVAKQWLSELNNGGYAGYNDWRLPTVEEAASLLEPYKKNDDLYVDPIFSNKQRYIWTGDKYGSNGSWHVSFYLGFVSWPYIDINSYVRPVRSGNW